jgi:hypothetical protein
MNVYSSANVVGTSQSLRRYVVPSLVKREVDFVGRIRGRWRHLVYSTWK